MLLQLGLQAFAGVVSFFSINSSFLSFLYPYTAFYCLKKILTFDILHSSHCSGKVVVELSKVELIQAAVILHPAWVTVDDIKGMDLNGSHCITFSRALY